MNTNENIYYNKYLLYAGNSKPSLNIWQAKYLKYKKKYLLLKDYYGGDKTRPIDIPKPKSPRPKVLNNAINKLKPKKEQIGIGINESHPIIVIKCHGNIMIEETNHMLPNGVTMVKSLPGAKMSGLLCPIISNSIQTLLVKQKGSISNKQILDQFILTYEVADENWVGAFRFFGAIYMNELYTDLNLTVEGLEILSIYYEDNKIKKEVIPFEFNDLTIKLSYIIDGLKTKYPSFHLLLNACSVVINYKGVVFGQENIKELCSKKLGRCPFMTYNDVLKYIRTKLGKNDYYKKYLKYKKKYLELQHGTGLSKRHRTMPKKRKDPLSKIKSVEKHIKEEAMPVEAMQYITKENPIVQVTAHGNIIELTNKILPPGISMLKSIPGAVMYSACRLGSLKNITTVLTEKKGVIRPSEILTSYYDSYEINNYRFFGKNYIAGDVYTDLNLFVFESTGQFSYGLQITIIYYDPTINDGNGGVVVENLTGKKDSIEDPITHITTYTNPPGLNFPHLNDWLFNLKDKFYKLKINTLKLSDLIENILHKTESGGLFSSFSLLLEACSVVFTKEGKKIISQKNIDNVASYYLARKFNTTPSELNTRISKKLKNVAELHNKYLKDS